MCNLWHSHLMSDFWRVVKKIYARNEIQMSEKVMKDFTRSSTSWVTAELFFCIFVSVVHVVFMQQNVRLLSTRNLLWRFSKSVYFVEDKFAASALHIRS